MTFRDLNEFLAAYRLTAAARAESLDRAAQNCAETVRLLEKTEARLLAARQAQAA